MVDHCMFGLNDCSAWSPVVHCCFSSSLRSNMNKGVILGIRVLFLNLIDMPSGFHITSFFKTILLRSNSHTIKFIISNYTTEWFLVNTEHCATVINVEFQIILSPGKETSYLLCSLPFPLASSPWQPKVCFLSLICLSGFFR